MALKPKKTVEDPVEQLCGSVKVKPDANPKKIAREWAVKRVEREIS